MILGHVRRQHRMIRSRTGRISRPVGCHCAGGGRSSRAGRRRRWRWPWWCRGIRVGRGGCGRYSTWLIHELDLVKRDRHIALAHAEEAADADDHGLYLAAAVHEHFADVADLLVVLVIDIQAFEL